jgi:small subunit ribosomal protein S6
MSAAAREYELVLMLDPEIPDERREEIASEARGRIESGGTLKHDTGWGMRKLAYEIRQRTEADYRFFRFETEGGLLDDLNHNLRIADGVLRFRIFKVDPGSPAIVPPPAMTTSGGTSARGPRRSTSERSEPAAPRAESSDGETAAESSEATSGEAQAQPADEAPAPAATTEEPEPATEEPAATTEKPEPASEDAEPPAEEPSEADSSQDSESGSEPEAAR